MPRTLLSDWMAYWAFDWILLPIVMALVFAAPAVADTPWTDATQTDEMTDAVTPAVGSVVTDGTPFGNQLSLGFWCHAQEGLGFVAKAEGLALVSMNSLDFKARVDKGPVRSQFRTNKNAAVLLNPAARSFASELMRGSTLRMRVAATDGNTADFVIPLDGFRVAFQAALPASCRKSR